VLYYAFLTLLKRAFSGTELVNVVNNVPLAGPVTGLKFGVEATSILTEIQNCLETLGFHF
jgi:hypothetical protein